jgi:hypothetical protein
MGKFYVKNARKNSYRTETVWKVGSGFEKKNHSDGQQCGQVPSKYHTCV